MSFKRKFGKNLASNEVLDRREAPPGPERLMAILEGALGRWPNQAAARAVRRKILDGLDLAEAAKMEGVDSKLAWGCLGAIREEVREWL